MKKLLFKLWTILSLGLITTMGIADEQRNSNKIGNHINSPQSPDELGINLPQSPDDLKLNLIHSRSELDLYKKMVDYIFSLFPPRPEASKLKARVDQLFQKRMSEL